MKNKAREPKRKNRLVDATRNLNLNQLDTFLYYNELGRHLLQAVSEAAAQGKKDAVKYLLQAELRLKEERFQHFVRRRLGELT